MRATGACVLLTGAGSGIGRALALELAARGARLLLVGRDEAKLAQVCQAIRATGRRADAIAFDLARPGGHDELVREAAARLGGLDILINNAGASAFCEFAEMAAADIAAMVATNLTAPLLLTRAALPLMARDGGGQVVNIGSGFGAIGFPHFAAYSATKFGLRGFSEALRRELAERHVVVTYVAPRATRTALNSAALYRYAQRTGMALDHADTVARAIADAIENDAAEAAIGGPERFFARLNALLPRLVDKALGRQTRIAREVLAAPAAGGDAARPADSQVRSA